MKKRFESIAHSNGFATHIFHNTVSSAGRPRPVFVCLSSRGVGKINGPPEGKGSAAGRQRESRYCLFSRVPCGHTCASYNECT